MVLSKLSESLRKSLDNLKSNKLDKNTVEDLNSNIKKALIQSDVSLDLVKTLNNTIEKRALNEKVSAGLSARDHVVNIVYEELTKLLGTKFVELDTSKKPSIIMMVGLFGAGKTTTTGKLAKRLKKSGKKIALIQTDTWRPAAYSQLKQLSEAIKIDFYGDPDERNPVKIYEKFENELKKYEIIIVDTAGRDSLNDELTSEIVVLNKKIKANEKLLVLSGDIGQSAKKIAESFEKNVGITGIIITKLDGTAKGGGALSAAAATNSNIKFIGTGEKLDNLEEFKPKNFVSRLLGMGDLETLLEKAKDAINSEDAEKNMKNMMKGEFSFNDLYNQMDSMNKMGSLSQIANLIPGMSKLNISNEMFNQQQEKMKNWKTMMDSMTKEEKNNPSLMNESRINRIVSGSGKKIEDLRELIKQQKQMKKMMKTLTGQSKKLSRMQKRLGKGGMPKIPGLF